MAYKFTREEILQRVDVLKVFTDLGYTLQKKDGSKKYLCPFHEDKTPSFGITEEGTYNCFGCKEKGNIFQLVIKAKGCTFSQAVNYLGDTYIDRNRTIPHVDEEKTDISGTAKEIWDETSLIDLEKDTPASNYLKSRGIKQHRPYCGLGKDGRIVFPISDIDGKLQGVIRRDFSPNAKIKDLFQKGFKKGNYLYNQERAQDYNSPLIITEGIFDCLAVKEMQKHWNANVVAVLGKPTVKQVQLMKDHPSDGYVLLLDDDEAGDEHAKFIIKNLISLGVKPEKIQSVNWSSC